MQYATMAEGTQIALSHGHGSWNAFDLLPRLRRSKSRTHHVRGRSVPLSVHHVRPRVARASCHPEAQT